jgi:hypothetical protein
LTGGSGWVHEFAKSIADLSAGRQSSFGFSHEEENVMSDELQGPDRPEGVSATTRRSFL